MTFPFTTSWHLLASPWARHWAHLTPVFVGAIPLPRRLAIVILAVQPCESYPFPGCHSDSSLSSPPYLFLLLKINPSCSNPPPAVPSLNHLTLNKSLPNLGSQFPRKMETSCEHYASGFLILTGSFNPLGGALEMFSQGHTVLQKWSFLFFFIKGDTLLE